MCTKLTQIREKERERDWEGGIGRKVGKEQRKR